MPQDNSQYFFDQARQLRAQRFPHQAGVHRAAVAPQVTAPQVADVGYNPALGFAPTPEGYIGRPGRQNPDYFGLNTYAQAQADAYNDLMGYGTKWLDSGGEYGLEAYDNTVRIDPWSGGVIQNGIPRAVLQTAAQTTQYRTRDDLQPRDPAFYDDVRAKIARLEGLPIKERRRLLGSREYQDALSQFVSHEPGYDNYGRELSPQEKVFNMFGSQNGSSVIDKHEADYLAKLAKYNDASAGYDAAWEQVRNQYMSPELDSQLRQLMPDDNKSYNNAFTTNYDHHVNTLNYALKNRGVESLSDIGATQHGDRTVFYNRRTGHEIDPALVNYKGGKGDGNVAWRLKALPDGNVTLDTDFKKPSKWGGGNWMPAVVAAVMSYFIGPAAFKLAGAMAPAAGAATQGAMAGAMTGAATSAMTGGNALKGAALGGLGGGLGQMVGSGPSAVFNPGSVTTNPALSAAINRGVVGGLTGAAGGALYGGDIGQAALAGGTAGAVSGGLGQMIGGGRPTQSMLNAAGKQLGNALFPQTPQQPGARKTTQPTQSGGLQQAALQPMPNLSHLPLHAQERVRSQMLASGRFG